MIYGRCAYIWYIPIPFSFIYNRTLDTLFQVVPHMLRLVQHYIQKYVLPYVPWYERTGARSKKEIDGILQCVHQLFPCVEDHEMVDLSNWLRHIWDNHYPYASLSISNTDTEIDNIRNRLQYMKHVKQYPQRSPEWYQHRKTMITASEFGKLQMKPKICEQIYQRKQNPVTKQLTNAAILWGVMFEPVATMLYERIHNVTLGEYGLIPHASPHVRVGASPDALVETESSGKYGFLVEIKCPYSRTINGLPSETYWEQMQMQLECCNLDYCDFWEVSFRMEWEGYEIAPHTENWLEKNYNIILSRHTEQKAQIPYVGVVIECEKDNKKEYFYSSLYHIEELQQRNTYESIVAWKSSVVDKVIAQDDLVYITTKYWSVNTSSLITVPRNKHWFYQIALPRINYYWTYVEQNASKQNSNANDMISHVMQPQKKQTLVIGSFCAIEDSDEES